MPRTYWPIPVYQPERVTHEEMERVLAFVRESCERDALPEWLTREVVARFKFEFVSDDRFVPQSWAERVATAMKPLSQATEG